MSIHTPPWNGGAILIGCRQNTANFLDSVLNAGHTLSGVLTLSEGAAEKANVPSWADIQKNFGKHIPVYAARTYKLSSQNDISYLKKCTADFGFCVGWQRLLPEWFLNTVQYGVFGQHACQFPLPKGRGRSPIHWSVINGADSIINHIFKYDNGADTGNLLAATKININDDDDIQSLQMKCLENYTNVALDKWKELAGGQIKLFPQTGTEVLEYKKRTPDDGKIDWSWPSRQIFNWIRAQTRPYPGAFHEDSTGRYKIWKSAPSSLTSMESPGTIIKNYDNHSFLVSTGMQETLLITEHEIPKNLTLCGRTLVHKESGAQNVSKS